MIPKSAHLEASDDAKVQVIAACWLLAAFLAFGVILTGHSGGKYWLLSVMGHEAPARAIAQTRYVHDPDQAIDTRVNRLVRSGAMLNEVVLEWTTRNGATARGRFVHRAGSDLAATFEAMVASPSGGAFPVVYLPLDPRVMTPIETLPAYRTDALALLWFSAGIAFCMAVSLLAARSFFRGARGRAHH